MAEHKRRGRPPKAVTLDEEIRVLLKPGEKERLKAAAARLGQRVSPWARQILLAQSTDPGDEP